jgi:hypothetical protein
MTTSRRPQQRYDHRLRDLVHNTGDVTIATDLGVPRSTARGWLRKTPRVAVTIDVTNVKPLELQQEVLALRRRVKKLKALLRLALALLRSSGFTLAHERLPDGRDKTRILRAVDRARDFGPLRPLLRFVRLSPSRFRAWRRQDACALDDQLSSSWRIPNCAANTPERTRRSCHRPESEAPTGSLSRSATATRSQSIGRHSARFGMCPQLSPRDYAAIGV